MFRRYISLGLLLILIVSFSGCGTPEASTPVKSNKLQIVTTLFPMYDFAKEIAGDKADVVLLLPPGVEPHAFEPTPKDVVGIRKSDLFIYTGPNMEPWAEKIIQGLPKDGPVVVNSSQGIQLMTHAHDGDEAVEADDHDAEEKGGKDPHIWLDPTLASKMVDTISAAMIQQDPTHKQLYEANTLKLKNQLTQLDKDFTETFKKTTFHTIIYGGHFAFGYFAQHYGLENISPYKGFSPDAEPTPARIAQLIETLKKTGQDTLYFEELIDPKIAKVISEQTGAKMLLLHGAHNLSKAELESGITYVQIMEGNLDRLKKGLKYHD